MLYLGWVLGTFSGLFFKDLIKTFAAFLGRATAKSIINCFWRYLASSAVSYLESQSRSRVRVLRCISIGFWLATCLNGVLNTGLGSRAYDIFLLCDP